jgi:hypothetical protein
MAPLNDAINQLVAKELIVIENLVNIKKQALFCKSSCVLTLLVTLSRDFV